jgi:hypothetical protein
MNFAGDDQMELVIAAALHDVAASPVPTGWMRLIVNIKIPTVMR